MQSIREHVYDVTTIKDEYKVTMESNLETGDLDFDQIEKAMIKGEQILNKIFRRELFVRNDLYYPENMFFEDIGFSCFFIMKSNRFARVEEVVYYYYNNCNSTCHTVDVEKILDRIKAAAVLRENERKLNIKTEYKDIVDYKFIKIAYISTLPHIMLNEKISSLEKIKLLKRIRLTIKNDGVDVKRNPYFQSVNSEMLRGWYFFEVSAALLYLYYLNSKYVKPIISKIINR